MSNIDSPFHDPFDDSGEPMLSRPMNDASFIETLQARALSDRDPDGSPYTSLEDKWHTDKVFSEMTTPLGDLTSLTQDVTPSSRVIEAGLRVLDSPVGEVAAGLAMSSIVAVRKVRERMQRQPAFGEETITTPLTPDTRTTHNDLATRIQRARFLHTTALSESTQNVEHLRSATLASTLLSDAQEIVSDSKVTMSFEEALTAAKARRMATTHPAFGPALDAAHELAKHRFAEVDAELLFKQALGED